MNLVPTFGGPPPVLSLLNITALIEQGRKFFKNRTPQMHFQCITNKLVSKYFIPQQLLPKRNFILLDRSLQFGQKLGFHYYDFSTTKYFNPMGIVELKKGNITFIAL